MYSQSWLESSASIKAIFVEAYYRNSSGVDTPVYLSSAGYMLVNSSIIFDPIIKSGVSLSESLSPDGNINFSFGDIELHNINGDLDSWLNPTQRIWVNRPIKIYLGDPSWSVSDLATFRTTFQLIFDGLISDVDSKNKNSINIKLVDKLQRLNSPLTEDKLGTYGTWAGGQSNKDDIKPIVFGEVHNFEPMLIDPSQLEYQINNGDTEELIEIRDNGVPLYTPGQSLTSGATVTLSIGKFKLTKSLAGTCTVSVQGLKKAANFTTSSIDSIYTNNIAKIIGVIVTQYGKASTRFSFSDIDVANFLAFSTANTQPVGIVINDRANVLSICQELAASVGAQLYVNRIGQLQLLKFGEATSDTSVAITASDMLFDSLSISNKLDIIASTKIGYCKNWYVQDNLLTGIPEDHKELFSKEWLTYTTTDPTITTNYKLDTDPEQTDTLLLTTTDATNEATRRNNLYKTQRFIYKFTGISRLLSLKLGQPVTLTHSRFNLSSGVNGQVVGLSPNWLESTVEVEVLV